MDIEAETDCHAEEIAMRRMDVDLWPDDWEMSATHEADAEPDVEQLIAEAAQIDVNLHNRVDYIIDYEQGTLSAAGIVALFQHLVDTGLAWQLQGSVYGRPAARMIEAGVLSHA